MSHAQWSKFFSWHPACSPADAIMPRLKRALLVAAKAAKKRSLGPLQGFTSFDTKAMNAANAVDDFA
jgi:hypothetical protein